MFYKLTQLEDCDCGFICLKILMTNLSKDKQYLYLKNEKKEEYSFFDLLNVASKYGFKVKAHSVDEANLKNIKNSIVVIKKEDITHFVIFKRCWLNRVTYYDPSNGSNVSMKKEEFLKLFNGKCLLLEKTPEIEKHDKKENIPLKMKITYLFLKVLSVVTLGLAFFYINTYFWSFILILSSFAIELIASYLKKLAMKRFDNLYELNKETFFIVQKIKQASFSSLDSYLYGILTIVIISSLIGINEPYMLILVGIAVLYRLWVYLFLKDNEQRIALKEKSLEDFKGILDSSYKVLDKYLLLNYGFYIVVALLIMLIMRIRSLTQLNYFLFYFFAIIFLANNIDAFIKHINNKDECVNYMNQYFDKTT